MASTKSPASPSLVSRVSVFLKSFKKDKKDEEKLNLQRQRTALRRSAVCAEVTCPQDVFTPKVIDAVEEVKYNAGDVIIKQGDPGDHFYLLEEGTCEVWLLKPGMTQPDMLKQYAAGDSFGELALLYNSPRAATIKATTDCTLCAMDRVTFRSILLHTTSSKRKLYEKFLEDVPLLKSLDKYERAAIADVLDTVYFEAGENIVVEGLAGDKFYLLEEGEAEAKKGGKVLMKYKRGDYFGELALLNNKPRAATVCAITKCKCASIDRQSFKRLFGKLENILERNKQDYGERKSKSSKKVSWFAKSAG